MAGTAVFQVRVAVVSVVLLVRPEIQVVCAWVVNELSVSSRMTKNAKTDFDIDKKPSTSDQRGEGDWFLLWELD